MLGCNLHLIAALEIVLADGGCVFVQVYGSCVDNAVMDRRPSYLCQADGNWYYHAGGCLCTPGYQPSKDLRRCIGIDHGVVNSSKLVNFFCSFLLLIVLAQVYTPCSIEAGVAYPYLHTNR